MKRIRKKIKEIMSRPSKNFKKIKNTILDFSEGSLVDQKPSQSRQPNMKTDFCLEEEAAHLAYRYSWNFPKQHSSMTNNISIEDESNPVPAEDKESNVRDHIIEKLERSVDMEDKEGWDALYT